MRDAFAREMTSLAAERGDVTLLSGDIGNRMFDRFKEVAPDRFMNCGIAEANMMSVAAGMALSGLRPVVYTITPFTTTRCFEQIRIDVAYHQAPVVIVGTGSGLSYAELGPTHHSIEDMAILRTLPGLNVVAPADSAELASQLREALESQYPTYMRIGKKEEEILHCGSNKLGIGKANLLRDGSDILVLGVGPLLSEAIKAAITVSSDPLSIAVASLGSIKPLDERFLETMADRYTSWITVEEHGLVGGIGSAILEWLQERSEKRVNISRVGIPDSFIHETGNQHFARRLMGLDAEGLATTFRNTRY